MGFDSFGKRLKIGHCKNKAKFLIIFCDYEIIKLQKTVNVLCSFTARQTYRDNDSLCVGLYFTDRLLVKRASIALHSIHRLDLVFPLSTDSFRRIVYLDASLEVCGILMIHDVLFEYIFIFINAIHFVCILYSVFTSEVTNMRGTSQDMPAVKRMMSGAVSYTHLTLPTKRIV